ncbi:MAG: hypothetical protein NVS2B14_18050 [Chamaesiphon sp.]
MSRLESLDGRAMGLFRFAGYGLLLLSLFDYVSIFIPPQFLNPIWEFQTMASLADRVPAPFLGLVLVFYGESLYREKREKRILKFLSWAALLVGVLFLLLIPLGIRDSLRINTYNEAIIRNQSSQQLSRSGQIEDLLNKSTSPEDINNALNTITNQGRAPQIKVQNPQEIKKQILSNIDVYQKRLKEQVDATLGSKRLTLLKESIKLNLEVIVSGGLFIYLWRKTSWTRQRRLK